MWRHLTKNSIQWWCQWWCHANMSPPVTIPHPSSRCRWQRRKNSSSLIALTACELNMKWLVYSNILYRYIIIYSFIKKLTRCSYTCTYNSKISKKQEICSAECGICPIAAIMEFYFRFLFLLSCRRRHFVLYRRGNYGNAVTLLLNCSVFLDIIDLRYLHRSVECLSSSCLTDLQLMQSSVDLTFNSRAAGRLIFLIVD